jgi:hypothetical protein
MGDAPGDSAAPATDSAPPSLLDTLRLSLRALLAQWLSVVDLVALEARLAALNLVEMIALALCAALCALTAWWLLLAALTALLVAAGVPLTAMLAGIAATNLALAIFAVLRLRKLGDNLQFSATRAALESNKPEESPPAERNDDAAESESAQA